MNKNFNLPDVLSAPSRSLVGVTAFRLLATFLILLQPIQTSLLLAAMATAPESVGLEAHLKKITFENDLVRIGLDKETPYRVFSLSDPARLVIELSNTVHSVKPYEAQVESDLLIRIRCAQFKTDPDMVTRVVLDMKKVSAYETSKDGSDILLRFKGAEAAADSKPPKAEAEKDSSVDSLTGSDSAELTSAAPEQAPSRYVRRSKDLIATLAKNPVTIDFENADIRDVLRVLSEMSNINIIHGSDISGYLTIHLDQVPFNQAFNTILTMQGLVAQQMGDNILRILTPAGLAADRARDVTITKTFTLNYAVAAEMVSQLQSVRISPNAKANVDTRTNSIVVTDTAEGIAGVERLLGELDQKPQQVMIETKIVEISLTDNLDLGIQWEYSNVNRNANNTQTIGIRETKTGVDADEGSVGFINGPGNLNNPSEVATANSVSSLVPSKRGTGVGLPGPTAAAITFGFINDTDLLTATLGALATKGLTKVLSSPKVITLNNHPAQIQVGSKIPYSTVTIGAGGGVATQNIIFQDVGILLRVKPTINADDRIRLEVRPEVSLPGQIVGGIQGIDTRNAETEVLIKDGETLVIGGLINEQTIKNAQKVPLLGDIPVLGVFFRSTSDQKRRTELLIFVTPRIVRD